ncbi:hypothetical protein SCP_1800920 [Sparassis crispa]|uniref:Uncharacterized protein n=1 Tax=Sparassis crispa TaxID=139825 RepID=A0A401H6T5_9APHY|nr:hypothetical protein SCP_1800920 [Sparassis crispa]GBE90070.1 hypothetical protein SCP_1800920 [Sparassis crispa]
MIGREATFSGQEQSPLVPVIEDNSARRDHDSVFFKGDRMYEHHILKVNYTTYDVRRSHDIINPSTDNRDILLLARFDDLEDATSMHPFLYARVLGIYHVNVVYTGTGMADYTPRRLDFLWVRWFQYVGDSRNWSQHKLDTVEFPPMADEETFGFIDPDDVLRACHIIPTFKGGKIHADEIGLSHCANDAEDWRFYHVNRFVDRDMLMRYHRGLGIGHVHADGPTPIVLSAVCTNPLEGSNDISDSGMSVDIEADGLSSAPPDGILQAEGEDSNDDNLELTLENLEDDMWDSDSEDNEETELDDSDSEEM